MRPTAADDIIIHHDTLETKLGVVTRTAYLRGLPRTPLAWARVMLASALVYLAHFIAGNVIELEFPREDDDALQSRG